ncbi:PAB-dependent poly-A-specific ribonuclease subunit PAN2 [Multifurca ochricompacta]|uniref:PAN2-PAN3 deadenylation complex catalytic subunit PAN2 n=1 Tax=Multifurca ochricompacta TaxID=376703 RepID=A0AAD4M6Q2_9AGAM|nr:PAB-dependent poly-A-specific ribonuclease subunit PAN2 [Multifurca ochricompacta]
MSLSLTTTYRPAVSIVQQHDAFPQIITALSFDPTSDTLWSGANSGNVTAYHTPRGVRGVSFPIGGGSAVKKIVADDTQVRAFCVIGEGMGAWSKGGINRWYYRPSTPITTFSGTLSSSKTLAVSTSTPEIVLLNATTGSVIRQAQVPSVVRHLHFTHSYLLSGGSDGYLRCHDHRTGLRREGGAENAVKAHISEVQGLQSSGNHVYTIGFGLRQSRPIPDPLVKIYDLRSMKPLPPVPFPAGPTFINLLPMRSSSLVVTSNHGLVNIVDTLNPTSINEFYQLDIPSFVSSTAVSPTGAYMAFGDSDGLIHILTAADETMPFNGYEGQPFEWAASPEPLLEVEWTDSTPLNSVGLPYYNTLLLSSWTPQLESVKGSTVPMKIPQSVLSAIKTNDGIAYAPLPRELKGRRNMIIAATPKDQGRFRSGKQRGDVSARGELAEADHNPDEAPPRYRKVEIEYSKFGVEDFDFAFFNKTEFSGLETHISNSYTNSLLQVLHYCHPVRTVAKSHITTRCPDEHCLLCELGFVSRMLEDAKGTNCQSSNFCKTVGVLAQSINAIELIDYSGNLAETNYARMIQMFHRVDEETYIVNPSLLLPDPSFPKLTATLPPIAQLLGMYGRNVVVCTYCKAVKEKEQVTFVVDLIYPRKGPVNCETDLVSVLQASLLRQMSHKATCLNCKVVRTFDSNRFVATSDLPPILAVNANVYNEESLEHWLDNRRQRFLAATIELHGQLSEEEEQVSVTYNLRAIIVQVLSKEKSSHLVAIVKVPETEHMDELLSPWFVFNDFSVQNVSEEEALSFPGKWKVPAILYLERADCQGRFDYSKLSNTIDTSILSQDTSISVHRDVSLIKHEPLESAELPRPGTLVAIDAEFVQMQQEETEFRSDGTKKVLRPARLSLARVSVLRGDGPEEGVPFIDDHIHTSEIIVDYLTEFSGIRFGDLDPHTSPYTLTPLKVVYKKLRLLVDRGCIFIGHGLSKDFRIINIYVPPEQVIDTVDLYFLRERQRRLSLRFLSWFVLHKNIQTDTHDSIEDARSALMLYKAYQDFEERGMFDEKLDELYREGRKHNWKPPASQRAETTSSTVPPPAQAATQQNALPIMHSSITPAPFVPSGFQGGVFAGFQQSGSSSRSHWRAG